MAKKGVFGRIHPAVAAIWAAVLAAGQVLPSIPMVGTGATFSISTALFPLSGVFFGPLPGFVTTAIGSFIGGLLAPHTAWMGMATFIIGAVSAFAAGCVTKGQWKFSIMPIAILVVFSILWVIHPIGRNAIPVVITYYGGGVIAIIVGTILCMRGFLKGPTGQKAMALFFLALAGMLTTASVGNYASIVLFALPAEVWHLLAIQGPLQRIIFSVGTAIIGVPLLVGLPKIGVFVGPEADELEQETEEE